MAFPEPFPIASPFHRQGAFRYSRNTMIKALIFDLDSCLAPANEPGDNLFAGAFSAIRSANNGHLHEDQLQAAFQDCWRFPFDSIADKYRFSPAMREAGFNAFRQVEVRQPMRGYGDLQVLAEFSADLFLVTSGFRRLQESKVRALGLHHVFTEILIDAIEESPKGKLRLFQHILRGYQLSPSEVLVVGDNPDSEIAAGNQLGMATIQILRPGVPASPMARHHIRNLGELKQLL
jgi:FMN phosphatase YigB (HAD superfamily)